MCSRLMRRCCLALSRFASVSVVSTLYWVTQTAEQQLVVEDTRFANFPVNMPLDVLLGKPPKMHRVVESRPFSAQVFPTTGIDMHDAVRRVLTLPSVAAKQFLITIGDRSITGQVVRDQLAGPWQMPVADVAVTVSDYTGYTGEAMAIGETHTGGTRQSSGLRAYGSR